MENEVRAPEQSFSESYVKELRNENASWRTKVRELETQIKTVQLGSEMTRMGINADPSWVSVAEGQSVQEALQSFVQKYPHLLVNQSESQSEQSLAPQVAAPQAMATRKENSNNPGPKAGGQFRNKSMNEIKTDAKSRAALRDYYKSLLITQSHQKGE